MARPVQPALRLERLEERSVPAVFGCPWADPEHLTVSFVPDGTAVNGAPSSLYQIMPGSPSDWQREIFRALQAWVSPSTIDVRLVADSGAPAGVAGAPQGDARFGDIRISARPLSDNVLAITAPPGYLGGTRAGDIVINSNKAFSIGGSASTYDLYSVMLQECGHALGIDNSLDPTSPMYETYIGVRTGLTAADVANIQALYGARSNDSFESNQTQGAATALNLPLGLSLNSTMVVNATIAGVADVDYYRVRTSLLNPHGLTVRLSTPNSLLAPKVTLIGPNGNVVGFTQSVNPLTGELAVSLSSVQSLASYYIRIEAANSAFATGDYTLKVITDPLGLAVALNLVGAIRDDLHTDDTLSAALRLTTTAGYSSQSHYSQTGRLRDASDVDVYVLRSAGVAANEPSAMTIYVRSLNPAALRPMVTIYNAQQQLVPARVLVNSDGTYTVQIPNTASNSDYYVKVQAADPGAVGDYQLDVDFRSTALTMEDYASGTLATAASTNRTMSVAESALIHFALAVTGPTGTRVRMTVYNQSGAVAAVLESLAGQTVTLDAYLTEGEYDVCFDAIAPSGSPPASISFDLDGVVVSDPIGPRPAGGGSGGTYSGGQLSTVTWSGATT